MNCYICLYFSHVSSSAIRNFIFIFIFLFDGTCYDTWYSITFYERLHSAIRLLLLLFFCIGSAPCSVFILIRLQNDIDALKLRRYFPFVPIIFHLFSFEKHSAVERVMMPSHAHNYSLYSKLLFRMQKQNVEKKMETDISCAICWWYYYYLFLVSGIWHSELDISPDQISNVWPSIRCALFIMFISVIIIQPIFASLFICSFSRVSFYISLIFLKTSRTSIARLIFNYCMNSSAPHTSLTTLYDFIETNMKSLLCIEQIKTSKLSFSSFKFYSSTRAFIDANCEHATGNDTNGRHMIHLMWMNISCICHTHANTQIPGFSFFIFFVWFSNKSSPFLFSNCSHFLQCRYFTVDVHFWWFPLPHSFSIRWKFTIFYTYFQSIHSIWTMNNQAFLSIRGAKLNSKKKCKKWKMCAICIAKIFV